MIWIVYMLRCGNGNVYTGITNNLWRRFFQHSNREGAKYLKYQPKPFKIERIEHYNTKSEAMSREYAIKQLTKQQKEELIDEYRR